MSVNRTMSLPGKLKAAIGEAYGRKLCAWVEFLRDRWRQGEPPFLAVEQVPFNYHDSGWPMENAPFDQRDKLNRGVRAILRLPNTATINTDDLTSDLTNIHPRNKAPIGKRLAEKAGQESP